MGGRPLRRETEVALERRAIRLNHGVEELYKQVAFTPIIWTFLAGGLLIALSSGYCVLAKQ